MAETSNTRGRHEGSLIDTLQRSSYSPSLQRLPYLYVSLQCIPRSSRCSSLPRRTQPQAASLLRIKPYSQYLPQAAPELHDGLLSVTSTRKMAKIGTGYGSSYMMQQPHSVHFKTMARPFSQIHVCCIYTKSARCTMQTRGVTADTLDQRSEERSIPLHQDSRTCSQRICAD